MSTAVSGLVTLCAVLLLSGAHAQLVPVKATITADNVYAIYWDTPSGLYFMGYEYNNLASGILSQPEYWPAGPNGQHNPTPPANPLMLDAATDNIYVVAWSDGAVYNGILFQFDINGVLITPNNPNWQVYPTNYFPAPTGGHPAINTELCTTLQPNTPTPNFGTTPFAAPCPDAVAQHVAFANSNSLWQQPVRGANNDNTSPYGVSVPGIPTTAKWMWWNSGNCGTITGPTEAPFKVYNQPCHHKEYLIFKMPVKAYQNEPANQCKMNTQKTACTGQCPLRDGQKVDCVGHYVNGKLQSCACECEDCRLVVPSGDPRENYCVGNCQAADQTCQPLSFGHTTPLGTQATVDALLQQISESPALTRETPAPGTVDAVVDVSDPSAVARVITDEEYHKGAYQQQLLRSKRYEEQEMKRFNELLLAESSGQLVDEKLVDTNTDSFIASCGCGPLTTAVCKVDFKNNKCIGVCPESAQTCIPTAFDLSGRIAKCGCNPRTTPCRLVQVPGPNGAVQRKCEGICADPSKQCKGYYVDGRLIDCTCSCCELKSKPSNPLIKRCFGDCDDSQTCVATATADTPFGLTHTKCGCKGCTASVQPDGSQLCSGECPTSSDQICAWQKDPLDIPRCTCVDKPPAGCYISLVNQGGTFTNVCNGVCDGKKCAFIKDPVTNAKVCDCPTPPPTGCAVVTVFDTTGAASKKCTGQCPLDPNRSCIWYQADPTQPEECTCPSTTPTGCQITSHVDPATGVVTPLCQGQCPTDPNNKCAWQLGPNGNQKCDCAPTTPSPCTLNSVVQADGTTAYSCSGTCNANGAVIKCHLQQTTTGPTCVCP